MQVISQQSFSYSAQCLLHGGDLNHNVRAVPLFFDHFLQPADLPFNPAKPFQIGALDLRIDTCSFAVHALIIYPPPLYVKVPS